MFWIVTSFMYLRVFTKEGSCGDCCLSCDSSLFLGLRPLKALIRPWSCRRRSTLVLRLASVFPALIFGLSSSSRVCLRHWLTDCMTNQRAGSETEQQPASPCRRHEHLASSRATCQPPPHCPCHKPRAAPSAGATRSQCHKWCLFTLL